MIEDFGLDSPLPLAPRTIREFLQHFQNQIDLQEERFQTQLATLTTTVKSLDDARLAEIVGCPLNPARKGENGQRLLTKVAEHEARINRLNSFMGLSSTSKITLMDRVGALEIDRAKLQGSMTTIKLLGLTNLVGLAGFIISLLTIFKT